MMTTARIRSLCSALLLVGAGAPLGFGAVDGDVSWGSLSHVGDADRRPLCPLNGEAFDVLFQTARDDATGARVAIIEGDAESPGAWIPAIRVGSRGPYDLWRAMLPGTPEDRVRYVIEVSDGADADYLSASGVWDDLPADGWFELDYTTLSHAPVGATPVEGGAVFKVWAPNAGRVDVAGSFNGWSLNQPLAKRGEHHVGFVPGAAPDHEYKFVMDGSVWKPDPRADFINNYKNFNSVITDPLAYAWRHPDFSPAPAEEWVIYQLHVGTFAGRNDPAGPTRGVSQFKDVTARVGHLEALGVNAVMLNPVNEFPNERSGGYNSISMYAWESAYGGPGDFKEMIDALHGAGIAVILDVVWNHFPGNDNFLWNFDGTQIYFDSPPVGTPWGDQADYDNAGVFDYFADSVEHVLGEYKIDGYRHDAIYEMVSASQWQSGQALAREMMSFARRRHADTHVVGEIYNNSAWNTSPGGIDLDGQYHEAYKNAIYDAVEAAAYGGADVGRLAGAIDGSGPWVDGDRVFNYFELHDEAWNLSGAGRTRAVKRIDTTWPHDDRWAVGRTKLANGLTVLAQGVPAILMGTEWLEDAGWETEKIDWSHKQAYRPVFDFYRDLIGERTSKRALFANSPCRIAHVNESADVLAFERYGTDGRSYMVVANFSNTDYTVYRLGVPRAGEWGVIINSDDEAYMGRGVGDPSGTTLQTVPGPLHGQAQRLDLSLPAHTLLLVQHAPEFIPEAPDCPGDLDGDGRTGLADFGVYALNFGSGPGATPEQGDLNGDGYVDLGDLSRFAADFGCGS